MEMSAAAKSKKIRDYAALVLPSLLSLSNLETDLERAVHRSWTLGEKMYEKEVETYDRIMKEAGSTRQSLAEEFSAIAARRGNTRDV